jgi:hypothetical protein
MISDSNYLDDKENNLNNPNKIDIYSRYFRNSFRNKSAKNIIYNYDFDTGKIKYKEKSYSPQKKRINLKMGRRYCSQKYIKSNQLILKDIDAKDEISFSPKKFNYIQQTSTFKSNMSISPCGTVKKKKNGKKKVRFKNKLVNIIEIESFKKYNRNDGIYDNAHAKCTCIIF